MKTVLVLMMVAVLVALGSAGLFMLRKGDPTKPRERLMARALAVRVALSVALFLLILLSWRMGWIRPSGIPAGS
jgi:type VI protein secretion system component VasK